MSHNKIKVEGARFIAKGLEENQSIEMLDVGSNIIRDKGMLAIQEAVFEQQTVKCLSAKNNNLTDKSFNDLAKRFTERPKNALNSCLLGSNDISIYALKLTDQMFESMKIGAYIDIVRKLEA
jgi:Ran GTPase-activating protein (RanGAP) involved in mRNA processing and transport